MKILIGGKSFEVKEEDLTKAQESGELKLGEDLVVRTTAEQDTWLNNLKPDIAKAAVEIEVKRLRNDLGLEFEGKTVENLVNAITEKNKVEFTKEPSKALEDKDKDIQLLKTELEKYRNEKETISSQFTEYKNKSILDSTLKKHIPDNLSIPKEDMLYLMQNKLKPTVQDGKVVFQDEKGDILKDPTTLNPLGADEVVKTFFDNNTSYFKQPTGGNGGSDSPLDGGKPNSLEAFTKQLQEQGKNASEINQAVNEAVTKGEIEI